ncbi:MAG: CPBP family intramembrane glutamic endopeptidase, partial [Bacteroidales bacterium]
LLPAIGEELLFRGVLQQLLSKLFANVHLGILVTAILFSAIHMQFFGFLPRIVLGLVLGYAFYLSGNIWMPVVIHFVNNAFAVVIAHLYYNDLIQQNFDEFGITTKALPVILSVILTLYVFYRIHINERKPPITESQTQ